MRKKDKNISRFNFEASKLFEDCYLKKNVEGLNTNGFV
jgi:hypothetical protein